jgi:hypothetical protein
MTKTRDRKPGSLTQHRSPEIVYVLRSRFDVAGYTIVGLRAVCLEDINCKYRHLMSKCFTVNTLVKHKDGHYAVGLLGSCEHDARKREMTASAFGPYL